MKTNIKFIFFLLTFTTFIISCNNEEIFEEQLAETVDEDADDDEIDNEDIDDEVPVVDVTAACDFSISDIEPNSTVIIDCILDLEGSVVDLPANVTLEYAGGDITNGTLNFSGGTISGELLNSTLTLGGSNFQLKDPVFSFEPERWGIIEGVTTSEIALNNRDILESILFRLKDLGVHTVEIDEMDAYFEVSLVTSGTTNLNFYASIEAIQVPADFNLIMTNNTHLRVQPNSRKTYALMAVREASNVKITGGVLHGDRDEHDYSDGGTHEWGYLLFLEGASDTVISDMTMKNSTGDGIKIQSIKFTFQEGYIPSDNITITRCIMDNNRRNNMSITGGHNIYVDNNQFLNASQDTSKSDGIAPGFALDVEATRKRGDDGELIYYERAEDIFITNNTEKGSRIGGFTVAIGYDVTIANNNVETGISFSLANGTRIIGNTVTATTEAKKASGTGIKAGRTNADNETIYDNQVYGNTVVGFGTGIMVSNRDAEVFDNNIENCAIGVTLIDLLNTKIEANEINSSREGSIGVSLASTSANDVTITNNQINVSRNPFKFNNVNAEPESQDFVLTVTGNELANQDQSSTLINGSNNIIINNNSLDHGFEVFDSNNISFSDNIINTVNDHGFDIRLVNTDINLSNNTISVSENKECINIDSTTNVAEVSIASNECN